MLIENFQFIKQYIESFFQILIVRKHKPGFNSSDFSF